MKTTLELPDDLFRQAKLSAVAHGITLKRFVTEALESKLAQESAEEDKPWMKSFGRLTHLRKETRRIEKIIEDEFESIDPEDWK